MFYYKPIRYKKLYFELLLRRCLRNLKLSLAAYLQMLMLAKQEERHEFINIVLSHATKPVLQKK